ncbi:hypothetical protein STAFG_3568 [Streptomyces afghaniensis 772]|uniref:HTH cro/C1-type domain-containing protein n=1 Tax=Streptomyces afghaniensis 772 TaxID=1283301 RepID=S4MZI9_9ACTN|nr:hypothetical protein STAFG_3568 [Streptomyces afghaniensis 772]
MAGSPTARRRRLSIELKKLREKSTLTCAQVGSALDWSGSKVNRMETGSGRIQPSDIDALCRFYGTSDELREFLKSLARQAKVRGWWQVHGAGVPEWFNIYIGLKQDASTFRQYQCEVVPGLMQTEVYASELHKSGAHMSAEDITKAVQVHMERQAMLRRPDAPDAWFIVNEGALRHVIGDHALMREQMERGPGDGRSADRDRAGPPLRRRDISGHRFVHHAGIPGPRGSGSRVSRRHHRCHVLGRRASCP